MGIQWSARYLVALVVGVVLFGVVGVFFMNNTSLISVLGSPSVSFAGKVYFLGTLFTLPETSLGIWRTVLFFALDVLFVSNVLVLYRLFRERFFIQGRSAALSFAALGTAIVGLGCFSCGSILALFLLSTFGATTGAFLVGVELWVLALSVVLFSISLFVSLRKLAEPKVCV